MLCCEKSTHCVQALLGNIKPAELIAFYWSIAICQVHLELKAEAEYDFSVDSKAIAQ
jgi:hypothetical protein